MPNEAWTPISSNYVQAPCGCRHSLSIVDQILEVRNQLGPFGTLLHAGHDWRDPAISKRSMLLLAEEVMPCVNAALD